MDAFGSLACVTFICEESVAAFEFTSSITLVQWTELFNAICKQATHTGESFNWTEGRLPFYTFYTGQSEASWGVSRDQSGDDFPCFLPWAPSPRFFMRGNWREAHFSRDFSLLVTLKYAKRGTPGAGKSVNGIRKHNRSTGAPHLSAKCVIILYFSAKTLSSFRKLRNQPILLLYYYYIKTNVVFIILKYNVDHVVRTGNETDI